MQHTLLAQLMARDPRKEVRFPDVPLDQALEALQHLEHSVEAQKVAPLPPAVAAQLEAMPPVVPATPVVANEEMEALSGSLAGLATQVWRAKVRIIDPETGAPREEMRRVYRHIESAYDVFGQMGLTIKDWMNQPYDAGLPVKVLAFQPTPGLERDTVLESVRPSVIWKDRLLQLGEVIVGIPPSAGEKTQ